MKLIGSYTSPFVRKISILLLEKGITFEFVNEQPYQAESGVAQYNPLGKVPALVTDDGEHWFDSPIIASYIELLDIAPAMIPREPKAALAIRQIEALADGIMDAAVLMRYERGLRPVEKQWDDWFNAQADKIHRALAALEQDAIAELASHFDIAAISLACALGYLDLRLPEFDWRTPNAQLSAWYAEVSKRPSMQATRPA